MRGAGGPGSIPGRDTQDLPPPNSIPKERQISTLPASPAPRRTYRDAAALYVQARLAPIPVKGKRPVPAGATGAKGTVTREKVEDWMANGFRWKDRETDEIHTVSPDEANTALRHYGTIGIDVDHYGEKRGADDLAALEERICPLPATISSTARGQDSESRQHVYRLPEGIDPTTQFISRLSDAIEIIQFSHRYSLVWPSVNPDANDAPYLWYDYDGEPLPEGTVPSYDDFEELPQEWVEFLTREAAERPQMEQWEGEQPTAASPDEQRKVGHIIGTLEALPKVWHPGAGWHDTVIRAACWLSRMVNSNAYALTAEQAVTILLTHTPVDNSQGGTDELLEQWASAVQMTEGQYEEPPAASRPTMLTPMAVLNDISPALYDLMAYEPPSATPGALWDLRRRIMVAALQEGRDAAYAASAAWHSRFAGEDLRDDVFTGESRLWREFDQAVAARDDATGIATEAAPADERPALDPRASFVALLTDEERKAVRYGDEFRWWGTTYLDWARTRVGLWNGPYHRLNRWHILSLIFSAYGYAPKRRGPMRFNVFGMSLGPSTTGKTESVDIMRPVWKAFFVTDDPDIGGDFSPNALTSKLIERDGKPSLFNRDEAHGLFKEAAANTYQAGLITRLTALYDCRVPMMNFLGQKDLSGKNATSYFVMHLMGVEDEIAEVLTEDMWKSGFLPRFVWASGDAIEIAPEDLEFDEMEGDAEQIQKAYDAMPRQWAAEFQAVIRNAGWSDENPVPIRYSPEARERHLAMDRMLMGIYKGHKQEAMLKPTLIRFGDNVRKCASLVAMSEGKTVVSERHELIALEQAEEWLENAIRMISLTTATGFARDMNEVERFVNSQPNGRVKKERVYRHMGPRLTKWDVDRLIENLVAQGRVEEPPPSREGRFIIIKQEGVAAA
jgi:hypothetical protein